MSPRVWRTYHLLVPTAGPGWQTPELQLGGTLASGVPSDGRQLGAALSMVLARPTPGRRPLAVAEYAAFAALLMLLIWAGLARLARGAVALGAALAIGALLLLWARLDPAGLAYLLPPLWGALLLPAGAAAAIWLSRRLAPMLRGRPAWLGRGLAAGLAGAVLLRAGIWPALGAALLLGGALVAAASLGEAGPEPAPATARADRWFWPAAAGCALLALGLRLYQLDGIPFGIWRDEARHGLQALQILSDPGYRPVYVPFVDIPALLFYLQTVSVSILGPTAAAVRAVPAIAGGLTALTIAALGRTLWGRTAGLAAALLLALSAWHIALSRLAFAAVLDPLLSLAALALLWQVGEPGVAARRRLIAGAAAGAALGLALYTYHPARLMPLAAALWVALRLGASRAAWRRALPALAAFALAGTLVATPLLGYWLTKGRDFNQRVGQVSLLDRGAEQRALSADLDDNITRYALMWHVAGDSNPRHNIPGTPDARPAQRAALPGRPAAAGRAPARREPAPAGPARGRPAARPALVRRAARRAQRGRDSAGPADRRLRRGADAPALARQPATARIGALAAAAAFVAAVNIWGYFGHVPYDPRVWGAFTYTADAAIGRAIQAGACRGQAWAPQNIADSDVTRYTAYGHSVAGFQASAPPAFPAGSCVFVPADISASKLAKIERVVAGSAAPQVLQRYPGTDRPVAWMYQLP